VNVLVIEDSAVDAENWRVLLEAAGHDVTHAGHGAAALDRLGERVPDVILLDLMLPVLDGYQFLEALRGNWVWKGIPVLVLTAAGEQEIERVPQDAGPVEVWRKPVEPVQVLEKLREMGSGGGGQER
jgi:CheY-like chemotaxis protein